MLLQEDVFILNVLIYCFNYNHVFGVKIMHFCISYFHWTILAAKQKYIDTLTPVSIDLVCLFLICVFPLFWLCPKQKKERKTYSGSLLIRNFIF